METGYKSILLGRAVALFANKKITKDEFCKVSYIIDKLPKAEIVALKKRKETVKNKVFDIRKHLNPSVDASCFKKKTSSTGFCLEDKLCEIFAEHLLETS